MNDRDLETLLRRYRPRGPASDLRHTARAAPGPPGRVWPWAVAAAALLCATIAFHTAANRTYPSSGASSSPARAAFIDPTLVRHDGGALQPLIQQAALVAAVAERDAPATQEVVPWR